MKELINIVQSDENILHYIILKYVKTYDFVKWQNGFTYVVAKRGQSIAISQVE